MAFGGGHSDLQLSKGVEVAWPDEIGTVTLDCRRLLRNRFMRRKPQARRAETRGAWPFADGVTRLAPLSSDCLDRRVQSTLGRMVSHGPA